MTERDIYLAVKAWLDPKEWVVIPQVRNATGFVRQARTADAVAVSCYPSKGIGVHGFEFKDSRSDWLRELKDAAKADEIGRFCSRWSVVVSSPDIAGPDEMPEAWGLLAVVDGKIKVRKKAPVRPALDPTWAFFAALMRAASVVTPEAEVEQRVAAAVTAEKNRAWQEYEQKRDADRKRDQEEERSCFARLKAFEEASGVKIDRYSIDRGKKIGEAVKFVLDGGLDKLTYARNHVAGLLRDIEKVMAESADNQPLEPLETA